jgi:hypothetical protein
MVSSFLSSIIGVLAAYFQKTGGFALYWPLAHAKIACDWQPVAIILYLSGRQSHANYTRVAASRRQIIPAWPSVACKLYPRGRQSHANYTRVAASRRQIPVDLFMLYATGVRLAASFTHLHQLSVDVIFQYIKVESFLILKNRK